jgi:hypothetical protein
MLWQRKVEKIRLKIGSVLQRNRLPLKWSANCRRDRATVLYPSVLGKHPLNLDHKIARIVFLPSDPEFAFASDI